MLDSMLGSVSAVWGHVEVSIPVSCALVFLSDALNYGLISSLGEQTITYQTATNRNSTGAELKAPVESNAKVEQIAAKLQKTPEL
jgi:hypothetical protein